MGDWDFLHEMHERGFSAEEIADAAASGAAPWEWEGISTDWLNDELADAPEDDPECLEADDTFRSREGFPYIVLEQTRIFQDLVDCAQRHFDNTGRYLQVWGELGEIYAEIRFGLRRSATHQAGSDGTIDGKRVEVKTISPEKASDRVFVKRQGEFEQLLVIRIDPDFQFKGKLFERSELQGATGRYLRARYRDEDSG
jgi:hypothetical protein